MKRWRTTAWLLILAGALCAAAGLGLPTAAEAAKVKVEVEVDTGGGVGKPAKPKKKAAPETFPVTLANKTGEKMFVAILYYDGNEKNWRCRGWWGVEPQKERAFKLSHVPGKGIYYYVERKGQRYSPSGTSKGVDWDVSKQAFSYLRGGKKKLDKPYRAHFVHGGTGHDGWWKLTINP